MTRELVLVNGPVAVVDDEDFTALSEFPWRAYGSPERGYYVGYGSRKKTIWLHRFLMSPPPEMEVDHINRDPLDNRRSNLRVCTHKENARNRSYKRARPGLRGAYPAGPRWHSCIIVDGKQIFVGAFATELAAALAYDEAAMKHFGEFAFLNFPIHLEPAQQRTDGWDWSTEGAELETVSLPA